MVAHVGPFAEIGLGDGFCPEDKIFVNIRYGSKMGLGIGVGGRRRLQLSPALKVLVVVDEVVATLAPCAGVYAAVFAGSGWFALAQGAVERFGVVVFIWLVGRLGLVRGRWWLGRGGGLSNSEVDWPSELTE